MYSYESLLKKTNIEDTLENRKYLKSIVHSLIKNDQAKIEKQLIDVNYDDVLYLYNILHVLEPYFDYMYNTKIDLTQFLYYILTKKSININAIFCPGYTENGYKDYVGRNNTLRLETLKFLSRELKQMNIPTDFKIMLANIFLENVDETLNSNWKEELDIHEDKFITTASKYFESDQITKLSDIYPEEKYIKGFINEDICKGKVYNNFYKNNLDFYHKMGWNNNQIKCRNDKLYTIYSILSEYINNQENGVYIPMETMYSRSKVMTNNGVCTMYLKK